MLVSCWSCGSRLIGGGRGLCACLCVCAREEKRINGAGGSP